MAARPIWRGHLRLALVSCPVALYSARHDRAAIRFNMINPETGNRIRMISQDAQTGQEIARRDTVKGYEFKKDQYLLLSESDLNSVKVESSSLMTVEKFVDVASIDPVYYDSSYYVAPDGKGADDVFAVLREAIRSTGKVALTRVVIAQRERTIAIRQMGAGLVAHTLNEQRDLNDAAPLFEDVRDVKVDPEMVQLAVQLVARQTGKYDPADLEDRYESRLRAMLDAKLAGEGVMVDDEPMTNYGNVVNIMDALRASLGEPAPTKAAKAVKAPVATKARGKKAPTAQEVRAQPGFKLPIEGGRKAAVQAEQAPARPVEVIRAQAPRSRRKAS